MAACTVSGVISTTVSEPEEDASSPAEGSLSGFEAGRVIWAVRFRVPPSISARNTTARASTAPATQFSFRLSMAGRHAS